MTLSAAEVPTSWGAGGAREPLFGSRAPISVRLNHLDLPPRIGSDPGPAHWSRSPMRHCIDPAVFDPAVVSAETQEMNAAIV